MTRLPSFLLAVVLCCFSFSSNVSAEADWLNPAGMTQIMDGYDDGTFNIKLGHEFKYYGGTFTDAWMSTNGFLMFYDEETQIGNPNVKYNYNGCCQPYPPQDNNMGFSIAPLWTDLVDKGLGEDSGYFYKANEGVSSFLWYNVNEFYNDNQNTFQINLWPDGSFDFAYDEVDITQHDVWIGFTGDVEKEEVNELFYARGGMDEFDIDFHTTTVQGGRIWYGQDGGYQSTGPDCSNPLNDPTCEGYNEAYTAQQCSQNPLYDPSCNGYEQAYTDQQCSIDPLYDPSCRGYEQAYLDQQCSYDPLYDTSCSGYAEAYLNQQCSEDALYDTSCPGYEQAYTEFQCAVDSQYDMACPGYDFFADIIITETYDQPNNMTTNNFNEFDDRGYTEPEPNNGYPDTNMGDTGSNIDEFGVEQESFSNFSEPPPEPAYNEPEFSEIFREELEYEPVFSEDPSMVEEEPELEEFLREEVAEERELTAERELREEVEEEMPIEVAQEERNTEESVEERETEASNQGGNRKSSSKVGLSVGLGTANALVSNLISNSIASGQSSSTVNTTEGSYGGSTGDITGFDSMSTGNSSGIESYFGGEVQTFTQITSSGQDFTDFTNTMTTESTVSQNIDDSFALGGDINVGISVVPTVEQQEMQGNIEQTVQEPTLAEVLAEQVRKKNAENQTGIFGKQESVLSNIASATDFTKYYEERISYASASWYGAEQVYPGNRLPDRGRSYYNMFNENYGTMRQLIRSQY